MNPGTLSAVAPQTVQYVWEEDFAYADQTDPGNVTAPVVPVDRRSAPATHLPAAANRKTSPAFRPALSR